MKLFKKGNQRISCSNFLSPKVLRLVHFAIAAAVCLVLYQFSLYSYLLFHSITEIFSIIIACGVFMIAWNSRKAEGSSSLVFLGIGYLFVALLDLIHTFAYRGMNIFAESFDYATKLWIAARYLQALTLVLFGIMVRLARSIPHWIPFVGYGAVSLLVLLSIFHWAIFPLCFVEGVGLTAFKKISEYVICALLLVSVFLVYREKRRFAESIRRLLAISIVLTILSELAFTFYVSSYGFSNLVGHFLKIAAFYFAYRTLIANEIKKKLQLIQELTDARNALTTSEIELKEANAAKDKFLSILAHDLRNPLSSLQTLAELVVTRYDDLDYNSRKQYCQMIFRSAAQGVHLLEQLLSWARAQTGRIEWNPRCFNLKRTVNEEMELLSNSAMSKKIELCSQIGEDTLVFADRNMIASVIRNFLSNAIKFTPSGGSVRLSTREHPDFVEVAVEDTGVGITEEDLHRLFRIDAHYTTKGTDNEGGNGLGLLVCKEFVEKNNGKITVESTIGEGSLFKFTIPKGN